MARDTAAIGPGITVGTATPDPETTVEALLRLHNRFPLDSSLSVGDRMKWDGTDWVADSATYALVGRDGFVAGDYYPAIGGTRQAFGLASGTEYAVPFPVGSSSTFDRIGINVTSAGTAGAVIRLGIKTVGADGNPDTVVVDAGTVDATTTGYKEITISETLAKSGYWLVAVGQGSPATAPQVTGAKAEGFQIGHPAGATATTNRFFSPSQTGITGALAGGGTWTGKNVAGPVVTLRGA